MEIIVANREAYFGNKFLSYVHTYLVSSWGRLIKIKIIEMSFEFLIDMNKIPPQGLTMEFIDE